MFKRNLSVIDKIITEFSRINNNMSIESILDLFDEKKINPRKIAKLQMQKDFLADAVKFPSYSFWMENW